MFRKKTIQHHWIWLCFLVMAPAPAFAFRAQVVEVIDGDTVMIADRGGVRPIHLQQIDCPQINQPFGVEAKELTRKLVEGKVVEIQSRNKLHALDIKTIEGRSLSHMLMRKGLAWYPKNYQRHDPLSLKRHGGLGRLEKNARKRRIGLWSQVRPIEPWKVHLGQEMNPEIAHMSKAKLSSKIKKVEQAKERAVQQRS